MLPSLYTKFSQESKLNTTSIEKFHQTNFFNQKKQLVPKNPLRFFSRIWEIPKMKKLFKSTFFRKKDFSFILKFMSREIGIQMVTSLGDRTSLFKNQSLNVSHLTKITGIKLIKILTVFKLFPENYLKQKKRKKNFKD